MRSSTVCLAALLMLADIVLGKSYSYSYSYYNYNNYGYRNNYYYNANTAVSYTGLAMDTATNTMIPVSSCPYQCAIG